MYVKGAEPIEKVERAAGVLLATGGVACGALAGVLYGLDSVDLVPPYVSVERKSKYPGTCITVVPPEHVEVVRGYRCASGLHTMLELANVLDDLKWEQALESALRLELLTIADLETALQHRRVGNSRIRRVLELRPEGAPPTGSLLETLAVQLVRKDPRIPTPERQVEVRNKHDEFVAFVDLSWPDRGLFLELDGGQHKGQPQYDATRQTAVVAATNWRVGRFTWNDIVHLPNFTLRRMAELLGA